jgi:hypothetical protein
VDLTSSSGDEHAPASATGTVELVDGGVTVRRAFVVKRCEVHVECG